MLRSFYKVLKQQLEFQERKENMNLIPLPDKIIPHSGTFNLVYNTSIVLDINQDGIDFETVKLLQKEIEKVIAITLLIKKGSDNESAHIENCISFKLVKQIIE